jgi:hypothetical protein
MHGKDVQNIQGNSEFKSKRTSFVADRRLYETNARTRPVTKVMQITLRRVTLSGLHIVYLT